MFKADKVKKLAESMRKHDDRYGFPSEDKKKANKPKKDR